ncbi:endospore germination permease [Paucisalibacillus globulus]|uniref:endospore germination permease n=1 Tax=Paucisalibacillus globulus TaxID=351095 RepID=UPI0003FF8928|nr:endospore germination permease [Paucisalibacillus globulus]
MNQINVPQLFFIFLLSTGLSNHVLIVPLIIDAAGRDSWISVIIGYLISIPFLLLLLSVTKQLKNTSVFAWLETTYNNTVRNIIALLLFVFLTLTGFITVKETVSWTHDTYLLNTPMLVVAFSILGTSLYISGRINVIAICAGIIFPFVVAFGLFVAVGTIPDKNYSLILPVLVENDWIDILKGSLFIFGSTAEVFILIMLQHHIIKKVTFRHLLLLTSFLFILTIGPLLGSMAIFGPEEAGNIKYPAFLQWRILSIGQYFNHLDFLSIYQWLSGSFIRLALILYLIKETFKLKKPIIMQIMVCILYLVLILAPISDEQFFIFLRKYFYVGTSIFAILFVVFMLLLSKKSRNKVSADEN